jgi:hypothetical protein
MFSSPAYSRQLPCWSIGFALLLILSSCTLAPTKKDNDPPHITPTPVTPTPGISSGVSLRPFVDTWNNIHPFLTFDYQISDPATIAKYYDFVWGARIKHVAAFRSGNPNIFITYYIPFHIDWGTFTDAHAAHDVTYWKKVHPDWILYQCDRATPAYHDAIVPLDFANPAVVSWEVKTYAKPASRAGYDGIAVDNLVLGNRYHACGVFVKGKWVRLYTGQINDPQWRTNVITWLARMQKALHSLQHPLALIPNIAFDVLSPADPQMQQLVDHIDGLVDEGGFTSYGRGAYLTGYNWWQRVQFMVNLQKQHKPYFLIDLFPSVGPAEIQWALASYLMGKGHTVGLFISTPKGYGSDVRYSEYNAQIGTPLGAMYQSQGVHFRNFSHGLSIVNSSATTTHVVTLNPGPGYSYTDLYGNTASQTVTLIPNSGLVLLRTSYG